MTTQGGSSGVGFPGGDTTYGGIPDGWSVPISLSDIPGNPSSLNIVQGYGPAGQTWSGFGPPATGELNDTDYVHGKFFGHDGIDIGLPVGTPLRAIQDGVVRLNTGWTAPGHPVGWAVIVHPNNEPQASYLYGHVSKFMVTDGQMVHAGDVIALSGGKPGDPGAGWSGGPHLHFEVRNKGNQSMDPSALIQGLYSDVRTHSPSDAVQTVVDTTAGALGSIAKAIAAVGAALGQIAGVFGWMFTHPWTLLMMGIGGSMIFVGFKLYSGSQKSINVMVPPMVEA